VCAFLLLMRAGQPLSLCWWIFRRNLLARQVETLGANREYI